MAVDNLMQLGSLSNLKALFLGGRCVSHRAHKCTLHAMIGLYSAVKLRRPLFVGLVLVAGSFVLTTVAASHNCHCYMVRDLLEHRITSLPHNSVNSMCAPAGLCMTHTPHTIWCLL
jgi:hypothetical protein